MLDKYYRFYTKRLIVPIPLLLMAGLLFSSPLAAMADDKYAENAYGNNADDLLVNQAGLESLRAGDYEGAEKCFRVSIKINPGRREYHNNLAVSLMRQGKYEEAIGPLEKAISIDSKYAKALSNMAIVCFHLSRYREAYGYYKLSRNADREYTQSRFSRDRVGREIDRLREEDPGNSVYKMMHNRLGKASGEKDWTMDEDPASVKP